MTEKEAVTIVQSLADNKENVNLMDMEREALTVVLSRLKEIETEKNEWKTQAVLAPLAGI